MFTFAGWWGANRHGELMGLPRDFVLEESVAVGPSVTHNAGVNRQTFNVKV